MPDAIVATRDGAVHGLRFRGGTAFRGIPYAAPPTGARRLAPPAPPPPWPGVRDCTHDGPPAPQPDRALGRWSHGRLPPGSEDCLTLNVFAPATGDGPCPVLVWLHGGGWTTGSCASPVVDGSRLAAAARCVVVTVNSRLGSLGWLHHPDLAPAAGRPAANWGLLDRVAALAWVRDNAAAFGGDPGRVTVGADSSGAADALHLLCVPQAAGLFSRVMAHSPPLHEATAEAGTAVRWAEELCRLLTGAREFDPGALRRVPAAAVVAGHERLLEHAAFSGTRGGAMPVAEPGSLPVSGAAAPYARPEVNVMLGTTADEATFFFRAAGRRIDPDERGLEAMVARLLPGGDPRARIAADRARAGANGAPTDPNSVLVRIATAAMFADPAERWSLARAAAGGRVYRCRTDHPSPEQGLGAVHTITVPLLFGTFRDGGVAAAVAGTGPGAERASRALVEATAGFLRDGNPGWPPVPATGPAAVTVFGGE